MEKLLIDGLGGSTTAINLKRRRKKIKEYPGRLGLAVLAIAALLLGGTLLSNAADKPIKLRIQSNFPPGSLAYDMVGKGLVEHIEKKSNGRLVIQLFPPDALTKSLELFDAVSKGAVDGGISAGLYHSRKVPESFVEFGLPFSFNTMDERLDFIYKYKEGEVFNIYSQAYNRRGVELLGLGGTGSYVFMTRYPVTNLDDFRGKKIRTSGLYAMLIEKLGATAPLVPAAEIYMALQRGTMDGAVFPMYTLQTYKLKEVINYVVSEPAVVQAPMLDIYLTQKTFNELPADLQKLLKQTAQELYENMSYASIKEDMAALQDAQKAGVKAITLSETDINNLRKISLELWDEAAKKSEDTAKLVALTKEYLKR